MSDTSTDDVDRTPTFLRQRGVRQRMRCTGQVAHRIEDTFVTVEQLVDAVKSDQPLTEYDGIGPKTAEAIEEWWEHRFKREEGIKNSSVERTGPKTATIHFNKSWIAAIESRSPDTEE